MTCFPLSESTLIIDQGLLVKCLPATDQITRIKFTRSCFRSPLPLLNPKTLQVLNSVWGRNILIVGRVMSYRGRYVLQLGSVMSGALYLGGVMTVNRRTHTSRFFVGRQKICSSTTKNRLVCSSLKTFLARLFLDLIQIKNFEDQINFTGRDLSPAVTKLLHDLYLTQRQKATPFNLVTWVRG